jgi:hypothetical protein
VTDKAVGRERIYRIDPVPLQSVVGWLEGYRAFWQSSLDQLKRKLGVHDDYEYERRFAFGRRSCRRTITAS